MTKYGKPASKKVKPAGRKQGNWATNVLKSFGYASADIIQEIMPSTVDVAQASIQAGQDLVNTIRATKNNNRKIGASLDKNYYFGLAKEFWKNSLEDIKSGKIYNQDRVDKYIHESSGLGDDFDNMNFDDMGFEDFDSGSDDGVSGDIESSDGSAHAKIATKDNGKVELTSINVTTDLGPDSTMVQATNSQSGLIAEVGGAVIDTNKASTKAMVNMLSTLRAEIVSPLNEISSNVATITSTLGEGLGSHFSLSAKYYSDSIALQTNILDAIKANGAKSPEIGLSDVNTRKTKEYQDVTELFSSGGALNIGAYKDVVKKQLGNYVDSNLILSQAKSVLTTKEGLEMIVKNPLSGITKSIVKSVIPNILKDTLTEFDAQLRGTGIAALNQVAGLRRSQSPIFRAIGEIFGLQNKVRKTLDKTAYNKGPVAWSGTDHQALTNVIPTLLRKMLANQTGTQEIDFDYNAGVFKTVKSMEDDILQTKKRRKTSEYDDLMGGFKEFIDKRIGMDQKDVVRATDAMEKFIGQMVMDPYGGIHYRLGGRSGKEDDGKRDDIARLTGESTNSRDVQLIRAYFTAMEQKNKSELTDIFGSRLQNQRKSYNDLITQMQENPLETNARFVETGLSGENRTDAHLKYNKVTGKLSTDRSGARMGGGIDKYGRSSTDYVRQIISLMSKGVPVVVLDTLTKPRGGKTGKKKGPLSPSHAATDALEHARQAGESLRKSKEKRKIDDKNIEPHYKDRTQAQYNHDIADGKLELSRNDAEVNVDQITAQAVAHLEEKRQDSVSKNPTFLTKIFDKLPDSKFKEVAQKIGDKVTSGQSHIGKAINKADTMLFNLVFGDPNKDGRSLLDRIKDTFTNKIFNPIKDKLFGDEGILTKLDDKLFGDEGFFTKIKQSQFMTALKERFSSIGNSIGQFVLGEKNADGKREGGLLSQTVNGFAQIGKDARVAILGGTDSDGNPIPLEQDTSLLGNIKRIFYSGKDRVSSFFESTDNTVGLDERLTSAFDAITNRVKARSSEFIDNMFGPTGEDGKRKFNNEFLGALSSDLKGQGGFLAASGTIGLVSSLFLPYGPVGGALIGTGIGIATKSKTIQNFLFGKEVNDGNGGTTRTGGLITKEFQNFVKDNKIGIGVGGLAGLVAAHGLLPSMLMPAGPIGGALAGAAISIAAKSGAFSDLMWGPGGSKDDVKGGIGQKFKEIFGKNADFKNVAIDAGIGAGVGLVGSFFLPGGPILGAMVGAATSIGLASNKFKNWFFGEEDKDGKREGGVYGKVTSYVKENIFGKMASATKIMQYKLMNFVETNMAIPFKYALQPLVSEAKYVKDKISENVSNLFSSVKDSIHINIVQPVSDTVHKYIIDPMKSMLRRVFSGLGTLVGTIISAPFKALGLMGDKAYENQMGRGVKDYKDNVKKNSAFGEAAKQKRKDEGIRFGLFGQTKYNEATGKRERVGKGIFGSAFDYFRQMNDADKLNAARFSDKGAYYERGQEVERIKRREDEIKRRNAYYEALMEAERNHTAKPNWSDFADSYVPEYGPTTSSSAKKDKKKKEQEKRQKERERSSRLKNREKARKNRRNATIYDGDVAEGPDKVINLGGASSLDYHYDEGQGQFVSGKSGSKDNKSRTQSSSDGKVASTPISSSSTSSGSSSRSSSGSSSPSGGGEGSTYHPGKDGGTFNWTKFRKSQTSIEKDVSKISDSVHGQLNGVGYNVNKIYRTLLKKWGYSDKNIKGDNNKQRVGLFGRIRTALNNPLKAVVNFVKKPFEIIGSIAAKVADGFKKVKSVLGFFVKGAFTAVKELFKLPFKIAGGAAKFIVKHGGEIFKGVTKAFTIAGKGIAFAAKNILKGLKFVGNGLISAGAGLIGAVGKIGKAIGSAAGDILSGRASFGSGIGRAIGGFAKMTGHAAKGIFSGIGTALGGVGGLIGGAARGAGGLLGALNPLKFFHKTYHVIVDGGTLDRVKKVKLVELVKKVEEVDKVNKVKKCKCDCNYQSEKDEKGKKKKDKKNKSGNQSGKLLPVPIGSAPFMRDGNDIFYGDVVDTPFEDGSKYDDDPRNWNGGPFGMNLQWFADRIKNAKNKSKNNKSKKTGLKDILKNKFRRFRNGKQTPFMRDGDKILYGDVIDTPFEDYEANESVNSGNLLETSSADGSLITVPQPSYDGGQGTGTTQDEEVYRTYNRGKTFGKRIFDGVTNGPRKMFGAVKGGFDRAAQVAKGSREALLKKFNMAKQMKEDEQYRTSMLSAVQSTATSTKEHSSVWSSIFSKKGLITRTLLLALPMLIKLAPKVIDFVKNFKLSELASNIVNGFIQGLGEAGGLGGIINRLLNKGKQTVDGAKGETEVPTIDEDGNLQYNADGSIATHTEDTNILKERITPNRTRINLETGEWENDRTFTSSSESKVNYITHKGIKKLKTPVGKLVDKGIKKGAKSAINQTKKGLQFAKKGAAKLSTTAVGKAASTASSMVKSAGSTVLDTFVNLGKKALDFLLEKLAGVGKKFGSKIPVGKFVEFVKPFTSKIFNKGIISKFSKKISTAMAKITAKGAGEISTAGLLSAGFFIYGAIDGATNAAGLFEVNSEDVTPLMRAIAAVFRGLLNTTPGSMLDLIDSIGQDLSMGSIIKSIATWAYSVLADEKDAEKLKGAQDKFTEEYHDYVEEEYEAYKKKEEEAGREAMSLDEFKQSDLSTTRMEYNSKQNKSLGKKIVDGVKSVGNFVKHPIKTTVGLAKKAGKAVGGAVVSVGKKLGGAAKKFGSFIASPFKKAGKAIADVGSKVGTTVKGAVLDTKDALTGVFVSKESEVLVSPNGCYYKKNNYGTYDYYNTNNDKVSTGVKEDIVKMLLEQGELVRDKRTEKSGISKGLDKVKSLGKKVKSFWDKTVGSVASATGQFAKATVGAVTSFAKETLEHGVLGGVISFFRKDKRVAYYDTQGNYYVMQSDGTYTYYNVHGDVIAEGIDEDIVNKKLSLGLLTEGEVQKESKAKQALDSIKSSAAKVWENAKSAASTVVSSIKNAIFGGKGESENVLTVGHYTTGGKGGKPSSIAATKGSGEDLNGMPYFSQNDPKYRSKRYDSTEVGGENGTIADRGCGPAVMASVATKETGKKYDPVTMAKAARAGGFSQDVGTTPDYFTATSTALGIPSVQTKASEANIKTSLQQGNSIILQGQGSSLTSPFTEEGHYINVTGIDGGDLIVNDPRGRDKSGRYSLSEVLQNTQGMWSFGKTKALSEDDETIPGGMGTGKGKDKKKKDQEKKKKQKEVDKKQSKKKKSSDNESSSGLTKKEKALVGTMYSIENKDQYSQDSNLRLQVGKGWGDCSSTVQWVYKTALGIDPGSWTGAQIQQGKVVDSGGDIPNEANLRPGDLLFYGPGGGSREVTHVEMYMGNGEIMGHGSGTGPHRGQITSRAGRFVEARRYDGGTVQEGAIMGDVPGYSGGSSSSSGSSDSSDSSGGFSSIAELLGGLATAVTNPILEKLGIKTQEDTSTSGSSSDGSTAASGSISISGSNDKEKIWNYLGDMGLTEMGRSGVMGCWEAESSNDPNTIEGWYLLPNKKADVPGIIASNESLDAYTTGKLFPAYKGGINQSAYMSDGHYYPGFGLAQWTGPRAKRLLDYSNQKGNNWGDVGAQLDFFANGPGEFKDRAGLKDQLNSVTTPEDAATIFLDGFEMSPGWHSSSSTGIEQNQKRRGYARGIYDMYQGKDLKSAEEAGKAKREREKIKGRVKDTKKKSGGKGGVTGSRPMTLEEKNDKILQEKLARNKAILADRIKELEKQARKEAEEEKKKSKKAKDENDKKASKEKKKSGKEGKLGTPSGKLKDKKSTSKKGKQAKSFIKAEAKSAMINPDIEKLKANDKKKSAIDRLLNLGKSKGLSSPIVEAMADSAKDKVDIDYENEKKEEQKQSVINKLLDYGRENGMTSPVTEVLGNMITKSPDEPEVQKQDNPVTKSEALDKILDYTKSKGISSPIIAALGKSAKSAVSGKPTSRMIPERVTQRVRQSVSTPAIKTSPLSSSLSGDNQVTQEIIREVANASGSHTDYSPSLTEITSTLATAVQILQTIAANTGDTTDAIKNMDTNVQESVKKQTQSNSSKGKIGKKGHTKSDDAVGTSADRSAYSLAQRLAAGILS